MRKFIFSILYFYIIMFSFGGMVNAQDHTPWKWSHQTPQGNILEWVKMFDANTWYAVGANGTFLKTTNAGASWYFNHKAGVPVTTGLGNTTSVISAWFFDMNTGVTVGNTSGTQQIRRTTNGGVTWDSVSGTGSGPFWGDVWFVDNNTGFVSGSTSGRFGKTTDGGQNWVITGTGNATLPTGTYNSLYAWDANNVIIAATLANIRKSTDGGTTWTLTQASTGTSAVNRIRFVDANTGFVVAATGNVWVSTNGGVNWTSKPTGNTSAYQDVHFKSSPAPLFTEESFTGVTFPPTGWVTINTLGAKVWNRSTTSPFTAPAASFSDWETTGGIDWMITNQQQVIAGDSLVFWARRSYTGAAFSWDTLKVMVSTTTQDTTAMGSPIFTAWVNVADTGASTFPPRLGAYQRYAVSLNSFSGQNVHIAFRHQNHDGVGLRMDDISVGLNRPPTLTEAFIVGDAFNIYRTNNLGDSYTAMGFLDPTQPWTSTYYNLENVGDTMVVVGNTGLINRSTNNGANWTTFTKYVKAGTLNDVEADPTTGKVWAVGAPGISGSVFDQVMYSTNRGADWTFQPIPNSNSTFNSISMVNSNTGYIAGLLGRIRKTTDGGTTWDSVASPITTTISRIKFADANTGWIFATLGTIQKTTDGGTTWTAQTSGVATTINDADFVNATTGWFVTTVGGLRKTTNGGDNWDAQTSNYGSTLNDIDMVDANTGYVVGLTGNMRKTTDGGTTWDTVATPVSTTLNDVSFFNANFGVIVGLSGYTARTIDGGASWILSNTGGGTINAVNMVHADTAFAVGLTAGIHKLADGTTGTGIYTSHIPEKYFLDQNYPNPFNPSTTIKFGLPREGTVSLKIYDMAGREVANIFNNQKLNAGQVSYKFDGSSLASGVYFYSLIVDNDLIATKKMVLVK
jgi:photosystem II stability/assembly factor-like uncharacterized protein